MKVETPRLPLFRAGVFQIWQRNWMLFKKQWITQALWMLWEPILVPLIFAYGVGFFVSNIKGFSYIDFFLASLMGISPMLIAFGETNFNAFSRLNIQRTYAAIILAPILPEQILLGEILWATFKASVAAAVIVLVSTLLGMTGIMVIPAVFISVICGFIFATLGVIAATYMRSFDDMKFPFTGLIIPMSLLCDTYFPVEQLPRTYWYLAQISPITHVVGAIRGILLGEISFLQIGYHLAFLLVTALLVYRWAKLRFNAKIIH